MKLTLVDGDPAWDGDGVANGTVVDPGFLASGERNFTGTAKRDSITGNVFANKIAGKQGNDRLEGGLGVDTLIGGPGNDRYIYTSSSESTNFQRDIVKFQRGDQFDFRSFDGNSVIDGRQKLVFIGGKAFSGTAGELRATRSVLAADLNGDSIAEFAVSLTGNTLLGNSSFLL